MGESRESVVERIKRRWTTEYDRGAHDYTDAGCRVLAEHAFRDAPALLAVVERLRDELIDEQAQARRQVEHLSKDPFWVGVAFGLGEALRILAALTSEQKP